MAHNQVPPVRRKLLIQRLSWVLLLVLVSPLSPSRGFAQGEVIAWGFNTYSQCNVPQPNSGFTAVAGGYAHSLGLKADGSIVAWGDNYAGRCSVPGPNAGYVSVDAGDWPSVGLKANGSVMTWGGIESTPPPNSDFISVAAGEYFCLGVRSGGVVIGWGDNQYGQCDPPQPNEGFLSVAGGFYGSVGLKSNGTIVCWGANAFGLRDGPQPNADFIAIAAGARCNLGLRSDGSIVAWGSNEYGQCNVPPPNSDFVAIASGWSHCLALKSDGTIVAWGDNSYGQCDVPQPNERFTAIAAGSLHSLGVKGDPIPVSIADAPNDQGGYLTLSWLRHTFDDPSVPDRLTTYEIQRVGDTTETLGSLPAYGSSDYHAIIATPEIYVPGGPIAHLAYRVVGRSESSATICTSLQVRCMSVDNLPPLAPRLSLDDTHVARVLMWQNDVAPDLGVTCLYRDTSPGFAEGVVVSCETSDSTYTEQDRHAYYYRARSADVHGNFSEWSNEVGGTQPERLFSDIASGSLTLSTHSAGVALIDLDADQDLDIFIVNGQGEINQCMLNSGHGEYAEIADPDLDSHTWNAAIAFGDANHDNRPDALLTGWNGSVQLLQNDGGGQFSDVTPVALAPLTGVPTYGAAWIDLDYNDLPDLYISAQDEPGMLFRNLGGGSFANAGEGHMAQAGMPVDLVAGDIDDDGDQDLFVVFYQGPNHLLRNDGHGRFDDVTHPGLSNTGGGESASFVDIDNDRDLDLYVVNYDAPNQLFMNDGTGQFTARYDAALQSSIHGQSGVWGDYDLDGDQDVFLANMNERNFLLRNNGGAGFEDITPIEMQDSDIHNLGASWGDIDGDGDLDLLVGGFGAPKRLWRNNQASGNHWLRVLLRATGSERSGIGSKIDVFASGLTQRREIGSTKGMWSQDPAAATFGLGASSAVDSIVVHWADGSSQRLTAPLIDAEIVIQEPTRGANHYYVAPNGDDGWPGTRLHPLRTAQHAVDVVAPGGTVTFLDGTYSGAGNVNVSWADKSLSLRSDSGEPSECRIECAGDDWIRYRRTAQASDCNLEVSGICVAHADTAIGAPVPATIPGAMLTLTASNCRIVDGNVAIAADWGMVHVENSYLARNVGRAVSTRFYCGLDLSNCIVRQNGIGVLVADDYGSPISIGNSDIVGNGSGVIASRDNFGLTSLSQCRVDSSTAGDGIYAGFWSPQLDVVECSVSGNAGCGIRTPGDMGGFITVRRSSVLGNGQHGIAVTRLASAILDRVSAGDNGGAGIANWAAGSTNEVLRDRAAARSAAAIDWSQRSLVVRGGAVYGNHENGIDFIGAVDTVRIAQLLVTGNGGVGIHVESQVAAMPLSVSGCTIADNADGGICTSATHWTADHTLVAYCGGRAVNLLAGSMLDLSCSDLFGNGGGDWSGEFANQLGVNGNLHVDPQFCNAGGGDYHLQVDSPLLADTICGCDTIGQLGAGCPALAWAPCEPQVRDVPGDQGGQLCISWLRHGADSATATLRITNYEVQRYNSAWHTFAAMAATGADSYAVTFATADTLILGLAAPFSRYRLLAKTALPEVFFESSVDSAYSIDNMPPPKPVATLVDDPAYRYIVWTNPDLPDLAGTCVFRGEGPDFVPGEPLSCPTNGIYAETHLGWYFYRVQFADTHGNLSEFSDELHGRFPTGVADALPTVLQLFPCRPNPFNPQTTIKYDLPQTGAVRLSVFDLAGRLVRTLVDESKPQGSFDVVWDGRDEAGREVSSGTYLARLSFGGQVETVRMGLVR